MQQWGKKRAREAKYSVENKAIYTHRFDVEF